MGDEKHTAHKSLGEQERIGCKHLWYSHEWRDRQQTGLGAISDQQGRGCCAHGHPSGLGRRKETPSCAARCPGHQYSSMHHTVFSNCSSGLKHSSGPNLFGSDRLQ